MTEGLRKPEPSQVTLTCLVAPAVVAVVTWLASVAMVAKVVMGVAREALTAVPPATVVETAPVTVPRLDTPDQRHTFTNVL